MKSQSADTPYLSTQIEMMHTTLEAQAMAGLWANATRPGYEEKPDDLADELRKFRAEVREARCADGVILGEPTR